MSNPFEPINARLNNLEALTLETLQLLRNRPATAHKNNEPVSPEELCKRLDISKPTAWAWEKKGILKGYHLGNRKYYIWDEVIASLKKGEGVEA